MLHVLWVSRGTGNAAPEDNLLQKLTSMKEAVLFNVFLYLQKSYDALDQDRCFEILVEYGAAPGRSVSFKHTGTSQPWWPGPADTLNFRSKGTAA